MRDLLDELDRAGIDSGLTVEIERQIAELERATGTGPPQRGDLVGAALTSLWVLACELRAKSLQCYGALGERERAFFDEQAESLEQSASRLGAPIRPPRLNGATERADGRLAPSEARASGRRPNLDPTLAWPTAGYPAGGG
jgi:hypothetical protein